MRAVDANQQLPFPWPNRYIGWSWLSCGSRDCHSEVRLVFEKIRKNIILSLMFNLCQFASSGMCINEICMSRAK